MRIPFLSARRARKRAEIRSHFEQLLRGSICIPVQHAVVCSNDHLFDGRYAMFCPCGSKYAWSIGPTTIRARLAEVREVRA